MLLKIIKHVLKIIRSAKISIKLTAIYAFMFSLVLLLLNASILYGVKYYMYNQANKQIEDMQTIILNKITSKNEQTDLASKEILSDVPSKENISIRIIQQDGKVINSSEKFDYNIKQANFKKVPNKEKHIEDKEHHLTYKNVKYESKKYGTVYIQIVKDMLIY